MNKINLKGKNLQELEDFTVSIGEKPFRGRQLFKWIYAKGVSDFEKMTDVSKQLRKELAHISRISRLEMSGKAVSRNRDTEKFLFRLDDGNFVETVLMRYEDQKKGRCTVCISSQVGCNLACEFCASGRHGLVRNLKPAEIVDQVIQVENYLKETSEHVHNVVIMGIGEPLLNFENVLKAIELINHGDGVSVSKRRIAVSTAGIPPMIKRLADENLGIKFAVSLHAPDDKTRNKIMPINKKYPIDQLLKACRYYQEVTGKRITFEYAIIEGINDSILQARKLARLLNGIHSMINIIPLNPTEHFPYRCPPDKRCQAFARELEKYGCKVTFRTERGKGIEAACGQLRHRRISG